MKCTAFKILFCMFCVCETLCLSGCQNAASPYSGSITNSHPALAASSVSGSEAQPIYPQTVEIKDGEAITGGIRYCVNGAEIHKEISEQVRDAWQDRQASQQLNGLSLTGDWCLLLVDLTLENTGDTAVSGQRVNCIRLVGFEEEQQQSFAEMSYYSAGDPESQSYFAYSLTPGESMDCQVGFLFSRRQFNGLDCRLVINPSGTMINEKGGQVYPDDARSIPLQMG